MNCGIIRVWEDKKDDEIKTIYSGGNPKIKNLPVVLLHLELRRMPVVPTVVSTAGFRF